MQALKRDKPNPNKPRRGRPKTSPLDPAAQVRERQRRRREKQREQGRVAVQLWIKGNHHRAITKSGQTLQDVADEAFALWMANRRGKSR
jgi:hypothetical protein